MKDGTALPAPPPLTALREDKPVALFVDFDGTLVELAETPEGITVPEGLIGRLETLAALLEGALALVSGRALIDLERHCGTIPLARAGSHGIDRRQADGGALGDPPEPMSGEVEDALDRFAGKAGIRLETKPHGGALHYRSNPGAGDEALAFAERLADEHGFDVKHGKFVIELVRPGADKGGAVRAFMQGPPFAGRRPVFIGDDVTDEDGIAAASEFGGFGILVGERESTGARYCLSGPAAVHDWLGL